MSKQVAGDPKLYNFFQNLILPTIIDGPGVPRCIPDWEPSPMTPTLWQDPEDFPAFQEVTCINTIVDEVKDFFYTRQDGEALVARLESLTLPIQSPVAMTHPEINTMFREFNPLIINGLNDYTTFLRRFVFRSINQILHVLDDSHAYDWSFTTIDNVSGWSDVCRTSAGAELCTIANPIVLHSRPTTISEPQTVSLVILPFMPWEFTEKDFINLSIPNRILDYRESDWVTKSDQIWTYLYNVCSKLDCHFFVITSYQRWCFGYFLSDWSEICFAKPINFDNSRVSIMGALIYWIDTSFEFSKTQERSASGSTQIEVKISSSPASHSTKAPQAKRQWLNEKILQLASADTWKWIQLPLGLREERFETAHTRVRRFRELQRIEDQSRARRKRTRYAQIKKELRKAKEARRAQKIEQEKEREKSVAPPQTVVENEEVIETDQVPDQVQSISISVKDVIETDQIQAISVEEVIATDQIQTIAAEEHDTGTKRSDTAGIKDVDLMNVSDSESEMESDIEIPNKMEEDHYNDWQNRVAEPERSFCIVKGDYTGIYHVSGRPEEYVKDFEFQVECVEDAFFGDLDYGTPDD